MDPLDATPDPDKYEAVSGYFPEHPDPMVSEAGAVMLVAAAETRNLKVLGLTLRSVTGLTCPNEVVVDIALHGAARLRFIDRDSVNVSALHFSRITTPGGERLWTFDLDGQALSGLYETAERIGAEVASMEHMVTELHRSGRSVCTAANEYPDDEVMTSTLRDSVLAHWAMETEPFDFWSGIARLALAVAEMSYVIQHGEN